MRTLKLAVVIGLAVVVGSPGAADAATRRLREVALRWTPTAPLSDLAWIDLTGVGDTTVELRPFEDQRARRDRIGENREDEPDVYPVATKDDVALWVGEGFARTFERVGLRLVERDGDLILRGAVRHLLLTERGGYLGEAAIHVTAETSAGERLWDGIVLGAHSGFGRFDRDRAYSETLSDTVLDAVVKLLQNSEFTEILGDPTPRDDS